MDIIDMLNARYSIKFTEEYKIIKRSDRKYFLLNTFDDKKYIFKVYPKNTNNLTKLKDANVVSHLLSKEAFPYSDYVINKEYDSVIEFEEDQIGTLYSFNEGEFLESDRITEDHLTALAELTRDFHKICYDIYASSFTVRQIEHIHTAVHRYIEKIREEVAEPGIHHMLENKFNLKIDMDILDLNLKHIDNINEQLKEKPSTVLNMDLDYNNVTFSENTRESGSRKDNLHITNIVFDRVFTGHPYFEIGKTVSRLYVDLKFPTTNKLKNIFLREISKPLSMQNEIMDTIICFNLIDMLYKYIKNDIYREETERFEQLKHKLIKENILVYI